MSISKSICYHTHCFFYICANKGYLRILFRIYVPCSSYLFCFYCLIDAMHNKVLQKNVYKERCTNRCISNKSTLDKSILSILIKFIRAKSILTAYTYIKLRYTEQIYKMKQTGIPYELFSVCSKIKNLLMCVVLRMYTSCRCQNDS